MAETKIDWFDDFLGLGYHLYDVRPVVFLLIDERKKVASIWNKILKYFPDDEIKVRFVEMDSRYYFVLYCKSRILQSTWVFFKSLNVSEHYRQFKEDYDGAAVLKLALYIKKKTENELEIFKYQKRITDVKFISEAEARQDPLVAQSIEKLHDAK
ncbi:MAG TPA: hypothetical protein VJ792_00180 [Candidatus Nitrosotalea sp.]|nr:hypothetical protein [Candidatus Nitrosotalea sp.]